MLPSLKCTIFLYHKITLHDAFVIADPSTTQDSCHI